MDDRVFFGSSIFSFNLRMYNPDITYWMRFPSTAELTHPVADMELAPDGRLWFGSGRAAYLDENNQMWVPPGTLEVYGQPTIRRISHGSREIFWVLGRDNFTEDENLLSRCDWMACDWVFLEPTLKIDEVVATSPDDAWLNGEGFLVHVRVGEPEIEPSGGYLRVPPTPTPGPISGGPTGYGAVHDGVVIPDDPFDQWGISANGGDIITLRLQNVTGASVLGLYLFRSDGSLVTFMTGPDEELRLTTPELFTDSYIIQVQLVDGEQASYRLHIGIP
ncbi:MAG: hypothetical protein M5R40_25865 [Anaerolineae bacterium]|nr:hypothetical protein [Anaerolineae bacterium]